MNARERAFTLVEMMIVVVIVGVLAALAIYGVRKYVANAKTAEARNSLGQMGKDASIVFEKDAMSGAVLNADGSTATVHALCASTSKTVPPTIASVTGKKYQSNPASGQDWSGEEGSNKGFPCLKFSMEAPQYYMYNYVSDGNFTTPIMGTGFTATANGDLNGDGVTSTFVMLGAVVNSRLYLAPSLIETDPEE